MTAMNTIEQLAQAAQTQNDTITAEFASLDLEALNFKPAPDSWSILECLEHLNRYSRYYNPALAQAIARHAGGPATQQIHYSWLGKKSMEMVRPQNTKKHRTVKHMNPNNSRLNRSTVDEFLRHLAQLLQLLQSARSTNLDKKAIPIEFFKLLKLRIGETLAFVVIHQERHIQQALRVKQLLTTQAAA